MSENKIISVNPHHPLAEILGRKLLGIEAVPLKEQGRIVNEAIKAAVKWTLEDLDIIEGYVDLTELLQAENKKLKEVLEDCKETISYVKQYVSDIGLSAEDDCNRSLKLIDQALKGTADAKL